MRTNIKTIAAIFILATIGLSSIKVAAGENKKIKKNLSVDPNQNLLASNNISAIDNFFLTDESIKKEETADFEDFIAQKRIAEEEKAQAEFFETAELITAEGADKEIEKYFNLFQSLVLTIEEK